MAATVLDRLYGARRTLTSGGSPVETLAHLDAAIAVLAAGCQHLLVPADPEVLSDDAPSHCTKCSETFRPADMAAVALAVARAAGQAEDTFTKREEAIF